MTSKPIVVPKTVGGRNRMRSSVLQCEIPMIHSTVVRHTSKRDRVDFRPSLVYGYVRLCALVFTRPTGRLSTRAELSKGVGWNVETGSIKIHLRTFFYPISTYRLSKEVVPTLLPVRNHKEREEKKKERDTLATSEILITSFRGWFWVSDVARSCHNIHEKLFHIVACSLLSPSDYYEV